MQYETAEIARRIRARILELGYKAGDNGAHFGSSLSLVEILVSIYSRDSSQNGYKNRDKIILSKGHGALGLFCALEEYGFIERDELDTFNTNGTKFFSHAKRNVSQGLEFSGGSLGLGLSYAVGVSAALMRQGRTNKVFCVVGDGELDEEFAGRRSCLPLI